MTGRLAQVKYDASPKGQIALKKAQDNYNASPKGIAARARYNASSTGKIARARHNRKRNIANRKSYGMDEAMIAGLLVLQNGCCAICINKLDKKFHCDHNHETKQPRGILCRKCNMGLGIFKDNPALLDAAKNYLNNPPVKHI